MDTLRIGCGAGFSAIAPTPPVPSCARSRPAGAATSSSRRSPNARWRSRSSPPARPSGGYEPLLDRILAPILAECLAHGIRIVSNFGAANPPAAAKRIHELAHAAGLRAPKIAVVHGDDLSGPAHRELLRRELGARLDAIDVAAANAYLGAEPIAAALRAGADIVVTGRVADPSLGRGPVMAHYGVAPTNGSGWDARPWRDTSSSAAPRSRAATSPIRDARTSRARARGIPDRGDRARRQLRRGQGRCDRGPGERGDGERSSCSTKSMILPPTSRPM
jgi:hypothetical protein